MKYSGAKIIVETLKKQNIEKVFGYPGGSILAIYDELYKAKKSIKHYLCSNEQGVCHTADGYARASGRVGVVFASSGPGATNLITGIATAYLDSIPLIIFTGNIARKDIGKDAFQEVDIQGISMPITKHNFIITDINMLEDKITEAFYIATSGRPGPVLIDIPKDIQEQKTFYKNLKPLTKKKNNDFYIDKCLELLQEANRPLIIAGGGVKLSKAENELNIFNKKMNSVVTATMSGLGTYDNYDEKFLGMIGAFNLKSVDKLLIKSDLVIAIGVRFSNKTLPNKTMLKNKKIIHIDIDPSEIDKNIEATISIIGDIKEILNSLNNSISFTKKEWYKNEFEEEILDNEMTPKNLILSLNKLLPKDTIFVSDVGKHQLWLTQYSKFSCPNGFVTSCGLGTMGFGLGGAVGTYLADDKRTIVLFTGDGSFLMNLNELATVSNYKIKLIIFVLNNNSLGLVKQWQNTYYKQSKAYTKLKNSISFCKIAKGFKLNSDKITEVSKINEVVKKALLSKKTTVIDVKIDINEDVTINKINVDLNDILTRS